MNLMGFTDGREPLIIYIFVSWGKFPIIIIYYNIIINIYRFGIRHYYSYHINWIIWVVMGMESTVWQSWRTVSILSYSLFI